VLQCAAIGFSRETRDNRAMVEVSMEDDALAIKVLGWSKFWCLKSRIDVPLRRVRQARVGGELPKGYWLRMPGTSMPGFIKAGSYWKRSSWSFWDIRRRTDNVLVIECSDSEYDYIVVEVKNPAVTLSLIQSALQRYREKASRF
jgi:hypothetical protein